MSNYVKSTNFTSKDSLASGDPLKIVKGTEFDTEFNAIQTAIQSKADTNSPTLTGTPAAPTAAAGTSSTQIATTAFVQAAGGTFSPTGEIKMWATGTAPSGFLLCNGAAVSRTTYANLYAVLGTTFGAGDGSTTFNLPNFNNRMPIGAGGLYAAGATGGSKDAIVVAHTHTATTSITDPGHTHPTGSSGAGAPNGSDLSTTAYGTASATGSATTGITASTTVNSTGSSGTDANLPPYLGVYFIVKT